MSRCEGRGPELGAFRDGELGRLARWRLERHLRRCDTCREELRRLEHVATWVRSAAELESAPNPDLWAELALRLPPRLEEPARAAPRAGRPWFLPLGAGVAAAFAAILLIREEPAPSLEPAGSQIARQPEPASADAGAVRALYAPAQPVVVVEDSAESTIIWVMDPLLDSRQEDGADVVA